MKTFFAATLAALVALASHAGAATITQWNFNSNPPDTNTGTGTTSPSIGTGTIVMVGGATNPSFNSGFGSSDPAAADNSGFQTTTYPAQGTNEKTAGVRFNVSTAGFFDISVSFDTRHSNTSANTVVLQYALDGTSPVWIDAGTFTANAGDTWFNNRSVDLSSVSGLDLNPNAAFRVVTAFPVGGAGYVASSPTHAYATTGTLRYDMITVSGTEIPEPAAAALIALAGVGLSARRRIA